MLEDILSDNIVEQLFRYTAINYEYIHRESNKGVALILL